MPQPRRPRKPRASIGRPNVPRANQRQRLRQALRPRRRDAQPPTKQASYRWPGEKASRRHTVPWKAHQQRVKPDRPKPPRPPLTPEQKQQRWRRQPVVEGGSLTKGQLRRSTRSAARMEFGPVEAQQAQEVGRAQAFQRDIGGYYDEYLRRVAQNSADVQRIGQQAQQAVQGLQGGVTGLAAADLRGLQGQANTDAAARGASAGDLSQMASNATAVRQALVGSFAAQQAAANAANAGYAGNLANVVAPGQKLQAVAQAAGQVRQARQARQQTAREKGAFKTKYRTEAIGEESKNVLAREIATGKTAVDLAELRERSRTGRATRRESRRAARARERIARRGQDVTRRGQDLSAAERAADRAARERIAKARGGGGSSGSRPRLTPGQAGSGLTQATSLKKMAERARAGQPFVEGHKFKRPQPLDRHKAAEKILGFAPVASKLKHPALVSAALDAVYDGHISPTTARRLRRAGYSAKEVAQVLGTRVRTGPTQTQRNTAAYRGAGLRIPR